MLRGHGRRLFAQIKKACDESSTEGDPGARSPAHARGRRALSFEVLLVITAATWHRGGDREWGLRPRARTAFNATALACGAAVQ
jgi:hypothetical protein